jgi:Flp pilus assembly protein TadD
MTRKTSRILVAVLLTAAFASTGYAQGRRGRGGEDPTQAYKGKGRITGKVLDENGQGVKDMIVLLRHAELMVGPNVKTNGKGEFDVKNLKGGEWLVRVQPDGYLISQLTIVVPDDGKAEPVELKLEVDRTEELMAALEGQLAAGDDLFKQGQFAAARAEYEKVLAARPDVTAVHRSIAYTYGREGNHEKALEHFDQALVGDDVNLEMLQLAAASSIEVKQPDRALGYLDRIAAGQLMDAEVFNNFAISMINKAFNPQAIKLLDRVVDEYPTAAMPLFLRGMAKLRMSNNVGGKADLEKFVELAPPDSPQLQQAKDILGKIG